MDEQNSIFDDNTASYLSMKEVFKGYSSYSKEEYKRIWSGGLIVVDTNILLNLYRYSDDAKNAIINMLKDLKPRLWIPYQVGKEFFENRERVMLQAYNDYGDIISFIDEKIQTAQNKIAEKNKQLKCKDKLSKVLEDAQTQAVNLLEQEKLGKKPTFHNDDVEKAVLDLFNNAIGPKIAADEYEKMRMEGQRRFDEGTPPGYKDKEKEENGDYYIFHSIIEKAIEDKRDAIFITDDAKEDWYNKINGEIHGGRHELLNEFFHKTNGRLLLIYTSDGFVKEYDKNIKRRSVEEEIIKELEMTRQSNDDDINLYEYGFDVDSLSNLLANSRMIRTRQGFRKGIMEVRRLIDDLNISERTKERLYHRLMATAQIYDNNPRHGQRSLDKIYHEIMSMRGKNEHSRQNNLEFYVQKIKDCCCDCLELMNTSEPANNIYYLLNQIMVYCRDFLDFFEYSGFRSSSTVMAYGEVRKLFRAISNYSQDEDLDDEKKNELARALDEFIVFVRRVF